MIILGVNDFRTNIVETVKEELGGESQYIELHIKPFFFEKRNELVRNVCSKKIYTVMMKLIMLLA